MKDVPPDPRRFDVERFARAGATLEGAWPLDQLPRLLASCHAEADSSSAPVTVAWVVHGEVRTPRGAGDQIWLQLAVETRLPLVCQRCLGSVATPLQFERALRFVGSEEEAAQLDADSEDDVLTLARHLDLQALVEDEILLALPLVPRHEACPPDAPVRYEPPAVDEDTAETPHPFAALAALKRGPSTPQ